MTILATLMFAAIAVYVGKSLLADNRQHKMQPIRINTEEHHTKRRR